MSKQQALDIAKITSGLKLGDDGIWFSSDSDAISYPADGNESCFAVEDRSFWFRHRNRCIVSVVNAFPPPDSAPIFDVGGGNGFVSLGLTEAGYNVALVEPGRAGALNARKRGVQNVICATTDAAKFRERSISAVGLFDVIEHIDDDIAFLQSIHILMKHGGFLYATVPAFPALWSHEDVQAGHFRRHTVHSISDTLKSAGFEVVFASYIFRILPVPVFLFRTLPFKLGLAEANKASTLAATSRDHAVSGGPLVRIMNRILTPEIENLKNKKAMAVGGSCLVVARCVQSSSSASTQNV